MEILGTNHNSGDIISPLLGGLLEVSSVGTIDLKPDVDVNMKLQEGIYAFYDNYAISGFILTVSDNIILIEVRLLQVKNQPAYLWSLVQMV